MDGAGGDLRQLATIGGPALSGSLVAVGGAAAAYLPAAVALLVSAVLAFLIAAPRQARVTGVGGAARFFEGVTFLRTRPVLLGAISLDMVAVLLGAVVALYPVSAPGALACCAPRRRWARWGWGCSWRGGHSGRAAGGGCSRR